MVVNELIRENNYLAPRFMSDPSSPDVPAWLSIAAAVGAVISALYAASSARSARRQAQAAEVVLRETRTQSSLTRAELQEMKRQSDISLHTHRLEMYQVFLDFHSDVRAYAASFTREKLWAFWAQVQLAEFYFSESIATALKKTVDMALELQKYDDWIKYPRGANHEEIREWQATSRTIFRELDDVLATLDVEIKAALRLMPS